MDRAEKLFSEQSKSKSWAFSGEVEEGKDRREQHKGQGAPRAFFDEEKGYT